ncbi:MAG: hypothetical protein V3W20_08465 [Candidatus Neomarinimicrobiota bacterium]
MLQKLVDTSIEYVTKPWHGKLVSRLCQFMRGYEEAEFNIKINKTTNCVTIKTVGKADII